MNFKCKTIILHFLVNVLSVGNNEPFLLHKILRIDWLTRIVATADSIFTFKFHKFN